ncbi:MAG: MotA/TolQ/ExbB proton channel family protein [bacterium]
MADAAMIETLFERYVVNGGIMMVALIPTSFIAVALAVQGAIDLRRARTAPKSLIDAARGLETPEDLSVFRERLEQEESSLARVTRALLKDAEDRGRGLPTPEERADRVAEEVERLYVRHNGLGVVYTVAPLMGLLGTILGMMRTFYDFAVREERSVAMLSEGINEALVTTMWGLFIAIPAYLVVTMLRSKIYRYGAEILPPNVEELCALCSRDRFGEAVKTANTTARVV